MARTEDYANYFGQTSKTILFERYTREDVNGDGADNLSYILAEWDNQVENGRPKDEILDEIEERLGVRTFKEFVEKFAPVVYEEVYTEKNTGEVKVVYSLEKPKDWDDEKTPKPLSTQPLYTMVEQLYEARKSSGQPLNKYDFGDVTKLLAPKAREEEYRDLRGRLSNQNKRYYELDEKNPGVNTPEKDDCIQAITNARIDFMAMCQNGITETFALQLQDAQNLLLECRKLDGNDNDESAENKEYIKGMPCFTPEGDLKLIPIEKRDDTKAIEEKKDPEMLLLEALEDDFKSAVPELAESREITNLVLSTISAACQRENISEEKAIERINACEKAYKAWNEALTDALFPVIEKFIGVKAFFDNATVDGKLDSLLIVANCTAEDLLKIGIKDKFEKFLEAMNGYRERRIWFGIIPAVALGNEVAEERTNDKPRGPYVKIVKKPKEKKISGLVSAENAQDLMWMCEKQQIMVFYNFKANEKTSLGGITMDIYEMMRDRITFSGEVSDGATGEYAVCSLPNFTLLPKRKACVVLNQDLVNAKIANESRLQLKGIYIDSSYVAAGMVVGSQQYDVLVSKNLPANRKLTGIRVDFEKRIVNQRFLSSMCIENLTPIDKKIEESIMESRFGFYFSDPAITNEQGSKILRCYVKNARTMRQRNGRYRKMNNVLFNNFINLCACDGESFSDEVRIRNFISNDVQKWHKDRQSQEQVDEKNRFVNLLLNNGENIALSDRDRSLIEITYPEERDFVKIKVEEKISNN